MKGEDFIGPRIPAQKVNETTTVRAFENVWGNPYLSREIPCKVDPVGTVSFKSTYPVVLSITSGTP